jgi:hypothetical protein
MHFMQNKKITGSQKLYNFAHRCINITVCQNPLNSVSLNRFLFIIFSNIKIVKVAKSVTAGHSEGGHKVS